MKTTHIAPLLITLGHVGFGLHARASGTHTWTGGSVVDSYWGTTANWSASPRPDGSGGEVLVFPSSASRMINTNNFLSSGSLPAFYQILLQQGGYDIRGNEFGLRTLIASYPAGSNCIIRCDLQPSAIYTLLAVNVQANNASLTLSGDIVLTNGPLQFYGAGDCTVSGVISGTEDVTKESGNSGDLLFSGQSANTYSGTTYVKDGILRLDRGLTLPGPIYVGAVAVPGDLVIGVGTNGPVSDLVVLERSNEIANNSKVTVNGTGQLDLNDHNDMIGALWLAGGSVITRSGTLTLNGDLHATPAVPSTVSGNLNLGTNATCSFDVSNWFNKLAIPANISGGSNVTLRKVGGGELYLSGTNSFTGPTLIEQGTLVVASANALGFASGNAILAGSFLEMPTLRLTNNTRVLGELLMVSNVNGICGMLEGWGDCGWLGPVVMDSCLNVAAMGAGSELEVEGTITGTGTALNVTGQGLVRFTGTAPNDFPGSCDVNADLYLAKAPGVVAVPGRLKISENKYVRIEADGQFGPASEITASSRGTLDLQGHNARLASLAGSSIVQTGGGDLTVSNHLDHTFRGTIRGGAPGISTTVTKDGPGAWTLTENSIYYQKTRVRQGRFVMNGLLSYSDIEIYPDATLGGEGTVQAIGFTNAGGHLAPGASVGTMTAQGLVSMAGGTLLIELNGATPGAGYDQLVTDVAPDLASGSLSLSPLFNPALGDAFVVISNRSSAPVAGTFAGLPEGAVLAGGNLAFQITYAGGDGNDVVVTRVAPPAATDFVGLLTSKALLLRAWGVPDLPYVLEAAPVLDSPMLWTPIMTNMANGLGLVQFLEPLPLPAPQQFYRIASP